MMFYDVLWSSILPQLYWYSIGFAIETGGISYKNNTGWWLKQPSRKMMEFVNGKDDIPYMKWKINNVYFHHQLGLYNVNISIAHGIISHLLS